MPVLMLLYLLQCFTRQVQFGLFPVGWLPTVLCPDLSIKQIRVSQTGILQQSTFGLTFPESKHFHYSTTYQDRMTVMPYFKEGLVVILVPATIRASCLLQESLQCSDLCREVSVRGFGLMEKIMLWTKGCMDQNSRCLFKKVTGNKINIFLSTPNTMWDRL